METNYRQKAKQVRLKVLEMIYKAGTSHIASNFSIIDVATVLYENLKAGDEVVWSKGWAAATIYYFLAQQGKIPKEDLAKFGKVEKIKKPCVRHNQGFLDHTEECYYCEGSGYLEEEIIPYLGLVENTTPGVYVNAGSMGHGFPVACGMALAKKLKGESGNIYCIMSDGEMNEGTTWESAMFAAHHKLDNLVVIIDRNGWQAMGTTQDILMIQIDQIFRGFQWRVNHYFDKESGQAFDRTRLDGHNFKDIEGALQKEVPIKYNLSGDVFHPRVVIFDTIKGKGVSFMEDHILYHYKHVDGENYKMAKAELENA